MIVGHDPSLRADEASPRAGCPPVPANALAALPALNVITSGAYWMVLGLGAVVFWALPRAWRFGFLALLSFGYLATEAPLSVCALSAWAALFYTAALSPAVRRRFGGWLWLVIGLLRFLACFIGLTRSPYLATYATMLAVGLWHAGSLGWICWGLYHASGLSVFVAWSRLARRRKWRFREHPLWRLAGVPVTFAFVVAGPTFPPFANTGGPVASVRVLAKMFFVSRLAGQP